MLLEAVDLPGRKTFGGNKLALMLRGCYELLSLV
jgi:hypothetical protein